jgi:hypothetical protein
VTAVTARELVRMRIGIDRPDRPERDEDAPCPSREFEPGHPAGRCDTDGHYMCTECVHASVQALADRYEP